MHVHIYCNTRAFVHMPYLAGLASKLCSSKTVNWCVHHVHIFHIYINFLKLISLKQCICTYVSKQCIVPVHSKLITPHHTHTPPLTLAVPACTESALPVPILP